MRKIIILFFIFTFLGSLAFYHLSGPEEIAEDINMEMEYLKRIFPRATDISERVGELPLFEVYEKEEIIGIGFFSSDVVSKEGGYGGPMNIMIGLDKSGKIVGIEILSHNETRLFMNIIKRSGFLKRFAGRDPTEIDTITGATITSEAIIRIVNKGSQKVLSETMGLKVKEAETNLHFNKLDETILVIIIVMAAIGIITKINILRALTLIISIAFIGFAKSIPISAVNVVNFLALKLPILRYNIFWYTLIIAILALTLIFGRVYCGWLCPFGAIQEFITKIKKNKLNPPSHLDRRAKNIKFILLWIVAVGALLVRSPNVADFEPYTTLFTLSGSLFMWAFVILTIAISIWDKRFWCKYLCPTGAFLGIISSRSPLRVKSTGAHCEECNQCINICPTKAIYKDDKGDVKINPVECIQCNLCINKCPEGRFYRSPKK